MLVIDKEASIDYFRLSFIRVRVVLATYQKHVELGFSASKTKVPQNPHNHQKTGGVLRDIIKSIET